MRVRRGAAFGLGVALCAVAAVAVARGATETGAAADGAKAEAVGSSVWGPLDLLGKEVAPGTTVRASWRVSESFAGTSLATPVLVVRGKEPGPTLCLTAGVHGDELNGIEVVRRSFVHIEPDVLQGTVIAVPIVNLHGFRRSSRYLPDRRDLNRYFPGRPRGSSASRIAFSFFEEVVRHCDFLVDMHTGSFHRTNLPQVRADLEDPGIFELARSFGSATVVHSVGTQGTLRRAAAEAGIPAITYEAGEPMRFQLDEVARGAEGVFNLLASQRMLDARRRSRSPDVYRRSRWVRVDDGGILIASVRLGERIRPGALLGTVIDPLSNDRSEVLAPSGGRLIGMALNQVVIPGFAAFHIGLDDDAPLLEGEDDSFLPEDAEDWRPEAVDPATGGEEPE